MSDSLLDWGEVWTLDHVEAELLVVEWDIMKKQGWSIDIGDVRGHILTLTKEGRLMEDGLLGKWHGLYAWYVELLALEATTPIRPAKD